VLIDDALPHDHHRAHARTSRQVGDSVPAIKLPSRCDPHPVRIDDLASAAVQRDAQGNAVALRKIVAPGGTFAGACAFKPQFASGYLVDEVVADAGAPNEVFPSSLDCP
jgi:hypothetical protein